MRTARLLGQASLGLLILAPALRLNVFSAHEAFELRRFLYGLVATTLVGALVIMTLSRANRERQWVYGVGGVIMLCLFNWSAFNEAGQFAAPYIGELLGQAVLPVAMAALVIFLSTRLSNEQPFHVLLLVVSIGIAASHLALVLQRPAIVSPETLPVNDLSAALTNTPDVFLVVLDGYTREDVLADQMDFENHDFLTELEDSGFQVPALSRSNYDSTYASLSSLFAMDYLLEPGPVTDTEMASVREVLRNGGPAVDYFRSAGYEFNYVESPWSVSACGPTVDKCYPYWTLAETTRWLAEFTIFAELTDVGSWAVSADHALDQFETLRNIAATSKNAPRLVYAHIGLPHPPFLLNAQCQRWDNPEADTWHFSPDSASPYLEQVRCVNHQVEAFVDVVIRSNPDAVVVITGDHGVSLHNQAEKPATQWTPDEIEESTAILLAYRLPMGCPNTGSAQFELVNTFRVVIDCLFGQSLGVLPGQQFHAVQLHLMSPAVTEFPASLP